MTSKKLTDKQLLGERGIALIADRVLKMGFAWRATAALDAGIDGEVEVRDRLTGSMSGLIIKVQSKAVSSFDNETATGFDYWPGERDVDYWLRHNVPVILVVSRPSTGEVFWQPIQDSTRRGAEKRIHFSKQVDCLDDSAATRLAELARRGNPGAVGLPVPVEERLTSNLLPVAKLPPRLYLAETPFRTPSELMEALKGKSVPLECSLREKRILTVRDLSDPRYKSLCDQGTVENFSVEEWSAANDADTQRDFVRLLNQCLRQFLRTSKAHIRYDRESGVYYFPSSRRGGRSSHRYQSQKRTTSRQVVMPLTAKKGGHVMGYRHSAMWSAFRRHGGQWYLEISPTYFFTGQDGATQSRYHSDWLSGIKRLEKNFALLGQLVMWEGVLARQDDLFAQQYPYLGFGRLVCFTANRGIDDSAWAPPEADSALMPRGLPLGLFEAV